MIETFTKEDAAAIFNMKPKTFAEHAKKHGLYAKAGRKVIYYRSHLERLKEKWDASNSQNADASGGSQAPSMDKELEKALERLSKPSQSNTPQSANLKLIRSKSMAKKASSQ